MNDEWPIWQLADATFPAGGLAHSGGLEAVVESGVTRAGHAVYRGPALHDQLSQTAHSSVPAVQAACENPAQAALIDRFIQAFLNNHVANRASRAQGKAFLISAEAAFGLPVCRRMRDEIQARRMNGHFFVVFGAVAAGLKIDIAQATRLFLYLAPARG